MYCLQKSLVINIYCITIYAYIPIQGIVLHITISSDSPTQLLPLQDGAGLLQVLIFVTFPPSHGSEQFPAVQFDQPPSTIYNTVQHVTYLHTYMRKCCIPYIPCRSLLLSTIVLNDIYYYIYHHHHLYTYMLHTYGYIRTPMYCSSHSLTNSSHMLSQVATYT